MRLPITLWIAFACGCASLRSNETVCPEYRSIHCATAPECSMDRNRGCQVCQCSPVGADEGNELPSALPPDRRP